MIALLGVVTAVVGTGLFANDDIAFHGPLFNLVDKSLSDKLSGLHALLFNVLAGLLVLHIAAIIFYVRFKKDNLVIPMLTGKKVVSKDQAASADHATSILSLGIGRFLVALTISGIVAWGVGSGVQYFASVKSPPVAAKPNW